MATYDAPRSVVLNPTSTVFRRTDDVNCYVVMDDQESIYVPKINKPPQKSCAWMVICSKFHTDSSQMLVANVQTLVARDLYIPWDLPPALQY